MRASSTTLYSPEASFFHGRNYQESIFPDKKSNMDGVGNSLLPDTLPIAITITNIGTNTENIILFDAAARQFLPPAFGNAVITSTYSTITYNQMLQAMIDNSFSCSYIRIINNDIPRQAIQPWFVTSVNMEGQMVSTTIPAVNSFSPFQKQPGVVDIIYPLKMDALTKIGMAVLGMAGDSTTTIYFYPDKTVNSADALENGSTIREYSAPKLPGAVT